MSAHSFGLDESLLERMTQMSKFRYAVVSGLLIAVMTAGSAKAAVEAVSFLNIDDFGFFVDAAGTMPVTLGTHINIIGAPLYTSAASANILSIGGGPIATVGGGPTAAGLETAIAQEGSAFANNSLFPLVNPAAPLPHAVGDTFSFGQGFLEPGSPIPFGADVYMTAQADLEIAGGPPFDIGTADSSTTSNASITIVPLVPLTIFSIFDATRLLIADLTPSPPGNNSTAGSNFSISVSDATGTIFEWQPDGVLGNQNTAAGTELSDPFSLIGSINTNPGTTNTFNMTTLGNPGFFSASVTLQPNVTYTIDITANASADVSSLSEIIPEASTIFVWSLLALCGGGAARYYSSRKSRVCA
jgi:hypothetical protein